MKTTIARAALALSLLAACVTSAEAKIANKGAEIGPAQMGCTICDINCCWTKPKGTQKVAPL